MSSRAQTFQPATPSRLAMHVTPSRYCPSCSGTFRPKVDDESSACPACGGETIAQSDLKKSPVRVEPTRVPAGFVDETIQRYLDSERDNPSALDAKRQDAEAQKKRRTDLVAHIAALRLQVAAKLVPARDLDAATKALAALDVEIAATADEVLALESLGRVIGDQIRNLVAARRRNLEPQVVEKAKKFASRAVALLQELRALSEQASADARTFEALFSDGGLANGSPRFDPAHRSASLAIGALGFFKNHNAKQFLDLGDRLRDHIGRL